jgi:glycosyltransferase involved in cell wall biosynthesis
VNTKYDLMYELFTDYEEARRSRPYRIYKWAVKHIARRIICISETTAADLHRLWDIDRARTDVVLLGCPLRDSNQLPQGIHSELEGLADKSEALLLSPYNLEPRKNLDALLVAMALLRERQETPRLILFGRAALSPARETQFERRLQELNLEEQVVRTGVLTDRDLASLYDRATIFVFPSLYEGFGLPLLEAMAAGKCVVARSASAMAEVVGEAGMLLETRDPEALAAGISRLLADIDLRQELGRVAHQRSALFSVDRMAQLTYQSYCEALAMS